jgi:multidrug transporter EmrE-like cation transporter
MLRQLAVSVVNLQTNAQSSGYIITGLSSICFAGSFVMLQEKVRLIPGSVQYTINRYHNTGSWNMEDMGMLVYHYEKK